MKAIYRYFLAIMVVMAFTPMASAQSYNEENGIALAKKVEGPNAQGQYTITLEAFTTGEVTVNTGIAPADIVLVLDYSTSMGYMNDSNSAMSKLRPAVAKFVTNIKSTLDKVVADDNGKHRIAFVLYSHDVYTGITGLNSFQKVEDLDVSGSQVLFGGNDLLGWNNNPRPTGTASGLGMEQANAIIKDAADKGNYIDSQTHKNSARSRIVVFFTDGKPTGASRSEDNEGKACIVAANTIKTNYSGTVYSVGLFTGGTSTTSATRESTFLSWTSSDFNDKTSYPPRNGWSSWTKVTDKYSFLVDNADKLEKIFSDISSEAGQSGAELGETSTVTVDVISASFTLPEGADKNNIITYTAKCIGATKDENDNYITFIDTDGKEKIKEFLFDTKVRTAGSELFSSVEVDDTEFEDNIISVKGFDYQTYYCAAEKKDGEYTGNFDGYKLIIEIPIIINPNSVGGPNTDTNDPKSGVFITDEQGHRLPTPAASFNRPTLPIPVNLVVRKFNLMKGESAKFRIERTEAYDDSNKLKPVTADTWSSFEASSTWTPLTTFVLTGDGISDYAEFSITGLSDRYYYRIVEESWSWSYTSNALTFTNSYQQKANPFVFSNKKENTTRKHAESAVTNIFKAGEVPVTIDSRTYFNDNK